MFSLTCTDILIVLRYDANSASKWIFLKAQKLLLYLKPYFESCQGTDTTNPVVQVYQRFFKEI